MNKIMISLIDYDLLLKFLKDERFLNKLRIAREFGGQSSKNIILNLDKSELRPFFDKLTYMLTEIGLDSESEVNSIGLRIEAILDQVSKHLY